MRPSVLLIDQPQALPAVGAGGGDQQFALSGLDFGKGLVCRQSVQPGLQLAVRDHDRVLVLFAEGAGDGDRERAHRCSRSQTSRSTTLRPKARTAVETISS